MCGGGTFGSGGAGAKGNHSVDPNTESALAGRAVGNVCAACWRRQTVHTLLAPRSKPSGQITLQSDFASNHCVGVPLLLAVAIDVLVGADIRCPPFAGMRAERYAVGACLVLARWPQTLTRARVFVDRCIQMKRQGGMK